MRPCTACGRRAIQPVRSRRLSMLSAFPQMLFARNWFCRNGTVFTMSFNARTGRLFRRYAASTLAEAFEPADGDLPRRHTTPQACPPEHELDMAHRMANVGPDRDDPWRVGRCGHTCSHAGSSTFDCLARVARHVAHVAAARIAARSPDPLTHHQRSARLRAAGRLVPLWDLSRPASPASRRSAFDASGTGSGKLFRYASDVATLRHVDADTAYRTQHVLWKAAGRPRILDRSDFDRRLPQACRGRLARCPDVGRASRRTGRADVLARSFLRSARVEFYRRRRIFVAGARVRAVVSRAPGGWVI